MLPAWMWEEGDGRRGLYVQSSVADLFSPMGSKEQELHILFENAYVIPFLFAPISLDMIVMLFCTRCSGVMSCPVSMLTEQKYDLQWGTNVLGTSSLPQTCLPPCARTHLDTITPSISLTFDLSAHAPTGHFHLRSLLLPTLLRASTPEHKSRIVITSSSGSYLTSGINWSVLTRIG